MTEEGSDLTQQKSLDENGGSTPQQSYEQIGQMFAENQGNEDSSNNRAVDSSAKATDDTSKGNHDLEYIIVTSVKGGCGKSSVSLRTAIELLEEDPKRNVIIIDMDILGTCLERFVDGKTKGEAKLLIGGTYLTRQIREHETSSQRYLTDWVIKDPNRLNSNVIWRDYSVITNLVEGSRAINDKLHIVFSSPEQAVKNMFQPKNASGYRSVVSIRYYKEVLRNFVQKLNDYSTPKFTHVIFDMPPNSDPYSECIYDILQKDEKVKKGEAGLELRVVSTYDVAHIQANLTWVEDYVHTTSYNNAFPTTIQFVFNQVFDVRGEIVKEDQEKIEKAPIAPLTDRVKKVFPSGAAYNRESKKTIHIVSEKVIQYKFDPKLALSSTLDTPFVITAGEAYRKEDGYDWKTGEKKEDKDK